MNEALPLYEIELRPSFNGKRVEWRVMAQDTCFGRLTIEFGSARTWQKAERQARAVVDECMRRIAYERSWRKL